MFEKEIVKKIEGIANLDVLSLTTDEIDKELDFLVHLYSEIKGILARFSLVSEMSTLSSIDDLLDRVETVLEWQGLLEHYDDSAVFVHTHLSNLKSAVTVEIEDKKLEVQFEDTPQTVNLTATDRRKYASYVTKDLTKKKLLITQQLLVWDTLKGQLRKKASDLKSSVQTLKALIHAYEVRPEIVMNKAEKRRLSEEERLRNLNSVKEKYLPKSDEDDLEMLLGDFEIAKIEN